MTGFLARPEFVHVVVFMSCGPCAIVEAFAFARKPTEAEIAKADGERKRTRCELWGFPKGCVRHTIHMTRVRT